MLSNHKASSLSVALLEIASAIDTSCHLILSHILLLNIALTASLPPYLDHNASKILKNFSDTVLNLILVPLTYLSISVSFNSFNHILDV